MDKRTKESEAMFLPQVNAFIPMSLLSPAYKRKCSLIPSKISEQVREQVSDRPARTARVVLAVSSHDSLRVRFFLSKKRIIKSSTSFVWHYSRF